MRNLQLILPLDEIRILSLIERNNSCSVLKVPMNENISNNKNGVVGHDCDKRIDHREFQDQKKSHVMK